MRVLLAVLAAAIATPVFAHEVKSGAVVVVHPLMRASLGRTPNTAAYFTVRNTGAAPDRLLSAACACAAKAELHATVHEGEVVRMRPMGPVTVPAGAQVAFTPAGNHLMLTGLKRPIEAGTMVNLTLRFEKAGAVVVPFLATARVEAQMNHGAGAHAH